MTDIIHELSRRIRFALNLEEIPTLGIPLKDSAGRLRPLKIKDFEPRESISNKITPIAYKRVPNLLFVAVEEIRRNISTARVENELTGLLKEL